MGSGGREWDGEMKRKVERRTKSQRERERERESEENKNKKGRICA